jgi:predicted DCC family thiol-disulfide oxidoreductase YuxK
MKNLRLDANSDRSGSPDRVYFDGSCGLCHGVVRFVLRRDRKGGRFRFAPLGGSTFEQRVSAPLRQDLPDSFVVETGDGRILARSTGVLFVLRRLGGVWGILARIADLIPDRVLDLGYDGVARLRGRLFRRPQRICPTADAGLRGRFDP